MAAPTAPGSMEIPGAPLQDDPRQLPAIDHGGIGPGAAPDALELFAEHLRDAQAQPGKHPNIPRGKMKDEGGV